jgi:heme/copper-type cytochrome/quinol oxidase subunit 2
MAVTTAQAQLIASAASVTVAAVLAYVTYQYYRETQRHTKEMRKNREAEFKPVLKATLVHRAVSYYDFAIVNTGKGAAHDVHAEWSVDDFPHTGSWSIPHLAPEERHRFAIQLEEDRQGHIRTEGEIEEALSDHPGVLHYEAGCTDALGNPHSFEEDIPLVETLKGRFENVTELLEKDERKEMRKELKKIRKSLKKVGKEIELDGNDGLIRAKMSEEVLDTVEANSEVSVQELHDLTGFSRGDLNGILRRLENANKIDIESEYERLSHPEAGDATIRSATAG